MPPSFSLSEARVNDLLSQLFDLEAIAAQVLGQRVRRIVPVERSGLQIVFRESLPGLRVDTWPEPGVVLLVDDDPARVKGGRGVWPDLVAAADALFGGARLDAVRLAPQAAAIELCCERGRLILVPQAANRGALWLESVDGLPRVYPHDARPHIPRDADWLDDAGPLRAALVGWLDRVRSADDDAERWVALDDLGLPLTRAQRRELAGCAGDPRWVAAIDAAAAGHLAAWTAARAERYRIERAAAVQAARRDALASTTRRELDRVQRALRAIEREEAQQPDVAELRRHADALLAAVRPVPTNEQGAFIVDNPWNPGSWLQIAAAPPGASAQQTAERLYHRARRIERGRSVRGARRDALEQRGARLADLAARAEVVDQVAALAALEVELHALGLAVDGGVVTADPRRRNRERRAGDESGSLRLFRSPGGFDVLVGRSARQNDRLTFKLAAPDDYWFHVKDYAGAHVVLKLAGKRDAERADLEFAARLAAGFSKAGRGEKVDVHVVRRKFLARPKGGAPGKVLVKKGGSYLRVTASTPPEPGGATGI